MSPLSTQSPIVLYARLAEASEALAQQIHLLDRQEPALATPIGAAWIYLDYLIKQLPAALGWEALRPPEEPLTLDLDPDVQREDHA